MDIRPLKLELHGQLAATSDAGLLAELKRYLVAMHDQGSLSPASGSMVQEPEPLPLLRAEVKRMLDEVDDAQVLGSVLRFLRGEEHDLIARSVLSARAARAEADLTAGRVYTQEQVEAHFKAKRAK